jgi:hypothetical protein
MWKYKLDLIGFLLFSNVSALNLMYLNYQNQYYDIYIYFTVIVGILYSLPEHFGKEWHDIVSSSACISLILFLFCYILCILYLIVVYNRTNCPVGYIEPSSSAINCEQEGL